MDDKEPKLTGQYVTGDGRFFPSKSSGLSSDKEPQPSVEQTSGVYRKLQEALDKEAGPPSSWRIREGMGIAHALVTHDSYIQMVEGLTEILTTIFGDIVWDDGADATAGRVLRYWLEMAQHLKPVDSFDGPGQIELPFTFTTFDAEKGQMICVPNIEFASLCAHHLLPFSGVVHIAYVSNETQVGLSKIPRLVDFWAQRPQVQEKLTWQIGADLKARLKPHGVMVVVEASHTCMSCRGVRKHNGAMVTSLPFGVFLSNPSARDEFYAHIAAYRKGA